MEKLKLLAICIIASSVIAIIVLSFSYATSGGDVPFDYAIVLDAGSSHTSANLYKWSGDKHKQTGEVIEVDRCSQEPGIASIEKPRLAGENVLSCTINVTKSIPPNEYRKSPIAIYLGATAGMRILQEENPEKSDHILDAVEKTFSCHLTDFQINQIDIISGNNEALSAWVSSNYITGNLINKTIGFEAVESETFGILDMGGGSAQIAYQVDASEEKINSSTINETDLTVTRLFGVSRTIRSSTNLCWGAEEAAKRYLASLIMNGETHFTASCLNKDFVLTYSGSVFKNKICYQRKGENVYDHEVSYRFTGLGDADKCKTEVAILFTSCDKMFIRCPTVETKSLPSNMTFIAMSTYYYTVRMMKGNETMNFDDFRNKANNFCRLTMDEASKSEEYNNQFIRDTSCFCSFYVPEYLNVIYKFKDEDWVRMRFINKLKNTDLGWSLGFMINATNAIPEEAPTPKKPVTVVFIALLVLLTLILFSGTVLLIFKYWKKSAVSSVDIAL